MDLVNRIKTFLNSQNISSSQFADTSDIPRPTLSQILNGRNKKISDEIIRKIHIAYPSLSISWLLFGEGEMLNAENISFSRPQNGDIIDFSDSESIDIKSDSAGESSNSIATDFSSDSKSLFEDSISFTEIPTKENQAPDSGAYPSSQPKQSIPVPTDGSKRIVNIMVFYSDNSFESFYPSDN